MPIELVAPIDVPGVGAVDDEHSAAEIRFRRLDEQVVVVRHEAESVTEPAEALDGRREVPKQRQIVPLVVKENGPAVAPSGYVVKPAGLLDACPMSHSVRP